jgi:hypothetical protein
VGFQNSAAGLDLGGPLLFVDEAADDGPTLDSYVLDWRVLAAVTGLGILAGGEEDLGLAEAGSRTQLQPTLDHYAKVRTLLIRLGSRPGLPVATLERGLYLMSRTVQGKDMTWAEYGAALAAATAPGSTSRQ